VTASTLARSSRPRQRRQLPFAAVLVGAVFLALATSLTIATLRAATDASRRAEALIANLESTVHEQAAVARGGLAETEASDLQATRARADEILTALALDERSSFGLAALRAALDAYRSALDEQLSALGADDLPRAAVLEAEIVDPTRDAFRRVRLATETRLETSATVSATAADIGTMTSLLSSAILASLLFRRWERSRRRNAFLVGEQHGLRESESRFRGLVQNSSDLIAMVTRDGTITYASPSAELLLGVQPASLVGRAAAGLIHPADHGKLVELLKTRTDWLAGRSMEWRLATSASEAQLGADWRVFESIASPADPDDPASPIVLNSRDVTDRHRLEESLRHQARHDGLTGLANRSALLEAMDRAMARGARNGTAVGLLFVDLDAFKDINDTAGHLTGDGALAEIASRVRRAVRADAVVARLGGDEFAVLVEDLAGPDAAVGVAERVQEAIGRPLQAGSASHRFTASIGIAISGEGLETADDLLAAADRAMYAAKRAGGARHVVFDGQSADSAVAQRRSTAAGRGP
jgi:diguanylate cyclase (GGDEF)-like protein/PAS domain S-box-containing protein